jgi:hypothetical protein
MKYSLLIVPIIYTISWFQFNNIVEAKMKGKTGQLVGVVFLVFSMMGCNLTTTLAVQPTPTEIIPPTPENTATSGLPPTFPPPMEVFTITAVPPTETETPTSTLDLPTATNTSTLVPYNPNATPTPPPTIPSGYHTATPHPYYSITPPGPAPTARVSTSTTAIQFTPSIDGNWGEWPNAETSAGYVVFGSSNWVNSNDLNASFKTAYDANNFYIAVKVIDDIYVQNATGYKIYLGDSIEILMDTNLDGDYYNKGLTSDDYQLGISPGKGGINGPKEAYVWYPANLRGARPQISIASQAIAGGYLVETAIPWSVFGINPVSGQHFGFALSVSDNDNPSQDIQESMVSSVSNRRFLNPTTWGNLTLQ